MQKPVTVEGTATCREACAFSHLSRCSEGPYQQQEHAGDVLLRSGGSLVIVQQKRGEEHSRGLSFTEVVYSLQGFLFWAMLCRPTASLIVIP